MANLIRIPIKGASVGNSNEPRYGIVNVDGAYDVAKSGSDEHIDIYSAIPAGGTNVIITTISYYANGGGTAVVTAQDIENFKDLILESNQNPASNPIFELEGAATAAAADLEDYQADNFSISAGTPK